MAENKNQHFVSQHYLRQFRVQGDGSRIVTCKVTPYQCVGAVPIKGQCQEDYFYGKADSSADKLLSDIEAQVGPALLRVSSTNALNNEDSQALRLLAVELNLRTRKAAEVAKQPLKRIADEVIKAGIDAGKLPEPPGGWRPGLMDFGGVPQSLLSLVLPLYMETMSLSAKLLQPPQGAVFITSDHPVVLQNDFAASTEPFRPRIGFSQVGFQLFLPLAPELALILYDPGVYKVGKRAESLVRISTSDVENLNAFQVQEAESCVYFHAEENEPLVRGLITRYEKHRRDPSASVAEYTGAEATQTLIHFQQPRLYRPKTWSFIRRRSRIRGQVGARRDPAASDLITRLYDDCQNMRDGAGFDARLDRIINRLPPEES